jgi:hypothetical protein
MKESSRKGKGEEVKATSGTKGTNKIRGFRPPFLASVPLMAKALPSFGLSFLKTILFASSYESFQTSWFTLSLETLVPRIWFHEGEHSRLIPDALIKWGVRKILTGMDRRCS